MEITGGSGFTQNKRITSDSTSDIISDLPCTVLEKILVCLTIKDAARTSVLSKKWRYIWTTLPQIQFDLKTLTGSTEAVHNKLMETIYLVLLQHNGPILKFTLILPRLKNCPEIGQLIRFLSNNGIQELTLRLDGCEHFICLPSSIFSCLGITSLDLSFCVLIAPPEFKEFGRLLCLKLYRVTMTDGTLTRLISACPLLERLTVERGSPASPISVEIAAPNLISMQFVDFRGSICFKNTPLLSKVSMYLKPPFLSLGSGRRMIADWSVKLLGSIPVIDLLELDYCHLKAVAAGGVLNILPTTLTHLRILKLYHICFENVEEISMVVSLMRSSPNLEKLQIKAFHAGTVFLDPVQVLLGVQGWSDIPLNRLREVEIHNVSGTRRELDFIKVLLAKSPILERLVIKLNSEEVSDHLRILKEFNTFRRLSPEAEVTFTNEDEFLAGGFD